MSIKSVKPKEFTMNILNGVALGVVVSLIPGALLSELSKALGWSFGLYATGIASSLMPIVVGVAVAINFKFTPIQIGSLGMACVVGSGVARVNPDGGFIFQGSGDVINTGLTAAIAVFLILLLGEKLAAFTILVIPTIVTVIGGGLGFLLLPYVKQITSMLGQFVATLTELQPVPMTMAIAVMFAMMIVSPIATVGIATAISLSGIASGAANLGICAAGFGLCIAGWKSNAIPTSLAHFIGSPKMQMANVVKKPKIMLPMVCSAAITGSLAAFLDLQGTPFSAGFGFSGLIGPINALALKPEGWTAGNIITTFIAFLVVPICLGFAFNYLFNTKLGIASSDDYKLDFN
ncbi:PTS sugar transporter subunit IIC [Vagococcus sp. DIV0080]|uniref:PTS sugar transporter subunit IIC n=1 Tax=Candidatus Vagococcus giribetii TaxID=2230876 RepID=A0ABS3HSV5_9ENTE|nr:PTS sugar transporter subunit IIC [Vagococcus sp. DIV0080]MBO0476832.1 PTS sugar transporter subunit IIC [Vagococcus sp. DIV0080]